MILKTYNVLVIGTNNSIKSIMAEALLNTMGDGVFNGYSAGRNPTGVINRFVLEEVKEIGYPYKKMKSKSWQEFTDPSAPIMNFVISVSDDIPLEALPPLPGNPLKAHWRFNDAGVHTGTFQERKKAFKRLFQQIQHRIYLFTDLPLAHLDQASLNLRIAQWKVDE